MQLARYANCHKRPARRRERGSDRRGSATRRGATRRRAKNIGPRPSNMLKDRFFRRLKKKFEASTFLYVYFTAYRAFVGNFTLVIRRARFPVFSVAAYFQRERYRALVIKELFFPIIPRARRKVRERKREERE